ncbi:MAG TPA: nicotinamide-nucleotide amidohydrolase family protein [Methylomirabilota bacterium]
MSIGTAALLAPVDPDGAAAVAALAAAGIPVASRVVIDEDDGAADQALAGDADLTVVIAPPDGAGADVARRGVARAVGTRLVLSDRVLALLDEHHRRRDRPTPRAAERRALVPQGAAVWATADGQPAWTLDTARGAFLVVPRGSDLRGAFEQQVATLATSRLGGRGVVTVRILKTTGVTLADVEERVAGVDTKEYDVTLTALPVDADVWVRIRARGATAAEATEALATVERRVADVLGADCYGRDDDSLEGVVGELLRERRLSLSVAESCTGGLLGHRLTNVAGSSTYFERGVVVYSNRAKQELLGVPDTVLRAHGAVSAETAEAMVRGVCERAGSACGIAVTGIAGPDGGSDAKPVGTVFIGVGVSGAVACQRFLFHGDRVAVKWQSSQRGLDMLRRRLLDITQ